MQYKKTLEYLNFQYKTYWNIIIYLVWLDCKDIGLDDDELNDFMINKARIALDGGSWFSEEGKGYMRINIACSRAALNEGLKRIKKAVDEYL